MATSTTLQEGNYVIFKREDKCKVFQIFKNRNIFFEKARINGEQLVGQIYGTQFEVQQGQLVSLSPRKCGSFGLACKETGSGKDNRDLIASEENQKLGQEDILKMKEEGFSGQEIVEKLVEQSETFKTKTEFSQEKYIKKKKKKHALEFRVLKPTACLLLDVYKKNPAKISNLRADSLSQMLCYGNVMAGATVAVVESCQGLVLGSVMERLGGLGRILHLYPGNDMNRQIVNYFNFPSEHMQILHEFPLNRLDELENGTLLVQSVAITTSDRSVNSTHDPESKNTLNIEAVSTVLLLDTDGKGLTEAAENNSSTKVLKKAGTQTLNSSVSQFLKNPESISSSSPDNRTSGEDIAKSSCVDPDGVEGGSGREKMEEEGTGNERESADVKDKTQNVCHADTKRKAHSQSSADQEVKRQIKLKKMKDAVSILQEKNLDSLIIATKHHPMPILLRLLPYVSPSRPVVVFCQYKEPLVECYTQVRAKGKGVQLRLSETWYREYQVLPCRTHPLMNMSGTGGYLLTFTTVTSS